MDWIGILALFVANGGLIFWMRSESRQDWRMMDAKMDQVNARMDQHRAEAATAQRDTQALIQSIQLEMKDFHHRLCAIEERRRKD